VPALPETFILSGPDQTKTFEGKEITFKFGGSIRSSTERLIFERRLVGADGFNSNWSTSYSDTVTYRLNFKGARDLVFQVRAKTSNGKKVDPTPASWSVKVIHSEMWGNITIGAISASFTDSNQERLTLSNKTSQAINITGWRINDLTSAATIGRAVEVLQPRAGLNFNSDVVLSSFGSATIHTQPSPIGFSFRENKCVLSLGSQNQILDNNQEYAACYFENRLDNDFLKKNWRIYLGLSSGIWDQKSVMTLRDESGAVVDVVNYGF